MLRHLTRDQIDVSKWDHCVDSSENGMVYGLSWYLDIIADNWSGLVWGNYDAIMPLTYRRKFGFYYLYQPRFTQCFGIYSSLKIGSELVDLFIDSIPTMYKYATIHLNEVCFLYSGQKEIISRDNYIVDLGYPYDVIRKKYSFNTRMNVKRTERPDDYHMKIENIDSPRVIIDLFSENQIKYSDRFTMDDYDKLVKLVEYCKLKKSIELIGVSDNTGVFCAGTILIIYKNRLVSIFSGSNQLARKQKTMFMLFDRIINKYSNQHKILDFAGSNNPGVAKFYSGFASVKENYPMLKYNHLPWFIKLFKK